MTLVLERVGLRAGGQVLLEGFSLRVGGGEVVTLRGPSGVGKSSLLACIAGALPRGVAGSGRVLLGGVDVGALAPHRRGMGILFQDDLLFPHLSVGDNLAFGLHPGVRGRTARREAVGRALADIELSGMHQRDPATLSGGQRARVGLMRVLLSRPRALLLDEPFVGLDPALRERLRASVVEQVRARQLPCLWVTHHADEAAGRVVEFPAAPGADARRAERRP